MGYALLGTELSSGKQERIMGLVRDYIPEEFEPGEMLVVFNGNERILDILVETIWTTHYRRLNSRTEELIYPAHDEYDKGRFPLDAGTQECKGAMLGYIQGLQFVADRYKPPKQIAEEMESLFGE